MGLRMYISFSTVRQASSALANHETFPPFARSFPSVTAYQPSSAALTSYPNQAFFNLALALTRSVSVKTLVKRSVDLAELLSDTCRHFVSARTGHKYSSKV